MDTTYGANLSVNSAPVTRLYEFSTTMHKPVLGSKSTTPYPLKPAGDDMCHPLLSGANTTTALSTLVHISDAPGISQGLASAPLAGIGTPLPLPVLKGWGATLSQEHREGDVADCLWKISSFYSIRNTWAVKMLFLAVVLLKGYHPSGCQTKTNQSTVNKNDLQCLKSLWDYQNI